MFQSTRFNRDISKWKPINVIYMSGMFKDCYFNQSISNWDVSKVKYMNEMFCGSYFNNDIFHLNHLSELIHVHMYQLLNRG